MRPGTRKAHGLVGALALLVGLTTGCESNQEAEPQKPSIGSQVAEGAEEESEKEKGSAAIEHGGITEVPDDPDLVEKGREIFEEKGCNACHAMQERRVGPALGGVTKRREPEWIARMIQHPREMLQKDPQARELLKEFGTRMADQNVSPEETRAILAYLGSVPAKSERKKQDEEAP